MLYLALLAAVGAAGYLLWKVSRLNKENQLLAARLVEVDQMKKHFISHVSHELKAPLASMQETTNLILERIPGPLTDKQKRLLELNLQSGKRLSKMLGNILDFSRLEAGIVEYEIRPADLADLMHNVVTDFGEEAREKSLQVRTDIQSEPLMIECDRNRMLQLFSNLVENAIRFSKKGGSIGVEVRWVQQQPRMPDAVRARIPLSSANSGFNGFALIGISDSGPGIEEANKEAVFHAFHQAKLGKKSFGESLGLGLAISRAVVQAHQGTIWVEDHTSGGAVFFVLLPRPTGKSQSLAEAS